MLRLFCLLTILSVYYANAICIPSLKDILVPRPRPIRSPNTFIVGGEKATDGQFPYQVSLHTTLGLGGGSFFCGGSIISDTYVLTSMTCARIYCASSVRVVAGALQLELDEQPDTEQVSRLHRYILNLNYHPKIRQNNIAIGVLVTPFTFSPTVQPVLLPPPDYNLTTGNNCTISGWGSTADFRPLLFSNDLLYTVVPVISQELCQRDYGELNVLDSAFCAGYQEGGHDACLGDYGGPLVEEATGLQVGISSFGNRCGRPGYPGVYTNVGFYREWITNNTGI